MAPPPPPPSDCFAKSCSGVWQPGPVSPLIRKDEVPKDILVIIAELQNLNGFWNLESKLANLIGCQQDKLNSAKPQNVVGLDDSVWATALTIAFLKTKVANRQVEWQLMSKKAQTWLIGKLKSEVSVKDLIKKATSVLLTMWGTEKEKK